MVQCGAAYARRQPVPAAARLRHAPGLRPRRRAAAPAHRLARHRRGLLFNLGILATLGNERPKNLFVVVWDNQCYQSIGGPPTHTAKGRVDLAAIARGAGVDHAYTVHDLDGFERHCAEGLAAEAPYLVVAKVAGTVQPGIRRKHSDGREDKYIFVRHVEASEGVTIMGPSEHN